MPTTDSLADRVRTMDQTTKVPGLLFAVTAERLRKHCRDRGDYHAKRAADKEAELPALQGTVDSLEESIDKIKGYAREGGQQVLGVSNKTAANYGFDGRRQADELAAQIDALRGDIREHRNKAASFAFLAESLFDKVYALEWSDLQRLEIVK